MARYLFILIILFGNAVQVHSQKQATLKNGQKIIMPLSVLKDKIRGGWAGQTIGVSFGGPFEFRFLGTMINEYQPLPFPDGYIKQCFDKEPGLYDDIYMDLGFVDVIEKYGVDAPVDSFANAFARAPFPLWHANQAARYNILNGIHPPQSGHWLNNPHADDIDFQIESDFAGLIFPGMCRAAAKLCDKVGHIMNYGDGYYGGLFMASMYCHAFISDDIPTIIREALKSIPTASTFYQCIQDVIDWHRRNPGDWRAAWFEVQKKWTKDIGCPDGVFASFDISARVNAAYVVMGLLYGNRDFGKTMEIAIRCGQDADCNPSSAAGILGTVIGYDKIPVSWKKNVQEVEDRDFVYTTISLNKMYALGYKQAMQMVLKNGGTADDHSVTIIYQAPEAAKLEQSFTGLLAVERRSLGDKVLTDTFSLSFAGEGIALSSGMSNEWEARSDYVFRVEVNIDGKNDTIPLPYNFLTRKNELLARYQLKPGNHYLRLTLLNPHPGAQVILKDAIIYAAVPTLKNEKALK